MKTWKITSTEGQILHAVELGTGEIDLSSKAGHHGEVTSDVWVKKLDVMKSLNYKIEEIDGV